MTKTSALLLLCLPLLHASFSTEELEHEVSHRLLQLTSKACPLGIQTEADFDISVSVHGSDVSTCTKDEMKQLGIFVDEVVNAVGSNGVREEYGADEAYFGAVMCTEASHGERRLRRLSQALSWSGGGRASICPRDQATASFNADDIQYKVESTLLQALPRHVDCLTLEFGVSVLVTQTTSMESTHYGCSKDLPKGFFDKV